MRSTARSTNRPVQPELGRRCHSRWLLVQMAGRGADNTNDAASNALKTGLRQVHPAPRKPSTVPIKRPHCLQSRGMIAGAFRGPSLPSVVVLPSVGRGCVCQVHSSRAKYPAGLVSPMRPLSLPIRYKSCTASAFIPWLKRTPLGPGGSLTGGRKGVSHAPNCNSYPDPLCGHHRWKRC